MNVKQFKKRWLNSKVEPELFYMPVSKKDSPMMFEIEVYNTDEELNILFINANYLSTPYQPYQMQILYNLRDLDGNKISPEKNPELFTDDPLDTELLQKDLVEHNKQVQLTIDWGDGEQTTFKSKETTFKDEYLYDTINMPKSSVYHSYSNKGKYIITVSGVCTYIYIQYRKTANDSVYVDNKGWKLTKIISFGDLDNTVLQNTYSAAIMDKAEVQCYLNFEKLKKVRKIYYLLYNLKDNKANITLEEYFENSPVSGWEIIGGDDFFHYFSKLIDASQAMYFGNIPYIPDYCFSDNPYLTNLNACFGYNPIKYTGKYACANLKYLISANSFCISNFLVQGNSYEEIIDIWDKYIGCIPYIDDGLFENCESLITNNGFNSLAYFEYNFRHLSLPLNNAPNPNNYYMNICGKIGDRVYKNCKNIDVFQFYRGFLLNSIGNEVFENCTQLQKVEFINDSLCLEHIGENIFKNCKNLFQVDFQVALNAALPLEIPDNFLNDIEFQNGVNYNFGNMKLQYTGHHFINYQRETDIRKEDLFSFLTYMNNSYNNEIPIKLSVEFIKKYQPNIYQQLEEIKNTFPNNYYIKFGKNMFNNSFLEKLFENYENNRYVLNLPLWYGQCYELYVSENLSEYYNVCCGEAPPFWRYYNSKIKVSFTTGYYGQENYSTTIYGYSYTTPMPVHYDNVSEIPYVIYEDNHNHMISMNGFNGLGYRVVR